MVIMVIIGVWLKLGPTGYGVIAYAVFNKITWSSQSADSYGAHKRVDNAHCIAAGESESGATGTDRGGGGHPLEHPLEQPGRREAEVPRLTKLLAHSHSRPDKTCFLSRVWLFFT